MSKSSEAVKRWRKHTKEKMVASLGGKCCICNYNKCDNALEFHHLESKEKEFAFGKQRANPAAWKILVSELRKCICVCSNCHREIHDNLIEIPNDAPRMNEDFADYKRINALLMNECPVCKTLKPIRNKTCSLVCSGKLHRKVDWDNIDLKKKLICGLSYEKIGDLLDCTGASVKKRAKKLGIEYLNKFGHNFAE